jgi:anti-sigma factor RsiW
MTCQHMRDRVQAYADGELGTEGVLEIEAHLARCPACREDFERQRAFAHAITTLYPHREPPAAVEAGVRSALSASSRRRLLHGGVAAALLLAASMAMLVRARHADSMPPEVRAAIGLHRAAQGGAVSLGLASSDIAEVNRWLRSALPFTTELPAVETQGFTVRGAAAVDLAGQRAGHVLYQAGGRPVSLFVLPARDWPAMGEAVRSGTVEFRWIEAGPDRVMAWRHDPVAYLLVSDAARAPAEACGVCHSNAGTRGVGALPADVPHPGRTS